jgi:energy-coupling factor transport system substrate-specific component
MRLFMPRLLSAAIFAVSALIGVVAFAYPFFLPLLPSGDSSTAHAADAPLLTVGLLTLCLGVLLLEVQGQAVSAKVVAALGVLVAITSALRLIEVVIPGPGGFTPIFAPIILAGHVFGARFGFLMGALTLLASALITAGVGPWLPYQMFAAGWMGLSAGWLPRLRRERAMLVLLAAFGCGWGLLYGAIMNLYFWPFLVGDPAISWAPGTTLRDGLARYAAFYLATSLVWDVFCALGNLALILTLGTPTIRALVRFRNRFHVTYQA